MSRIGAGAPIGPDERGASALIGPIQANAPGLRLAERLRATNISAIGLLGSSALLFKHC